jgi:hypothetical protein
MNIKKKKKKLSKKWKKLSISFLLHTLEKSPANKKISPSFQCFKKKKKKKQEF